MISLPVLLVTALLVLTPAPAAAYVTAPWSPILLWKPAPNVSPEPLSYLLYNDSGTRIFVHHYDTGSNYTFEPAQSGYLSDGQRKLKFHPTEIRCSSTDPSQRCIVRPVWFGLLPGIVLDLIDKQPLTLAKENRPDFRQQRYVPSNVVSLSSPSRNRVDLRKLLRAYLERMVTIYYRSGEADMNRKLAKLKSWFKRTLWQTVPRDLIPELERYEAVCQCIHNNTRSGLSIQEIFRQNTCGPHTTKQIRSKILSRVR
jgi:hypothetical protein